MRATSSWDVLAVKRKTVNRESGLSRASGHNRGETVMDRDEEVMVGATDDTVTVGVQGRGILVVPM